MWNILSFIALMWCGVLYIDAKAEDAQNSVADDQDSSKEGNFLVPYFEQPRPLIGFGQTIVKDPGTWIVGTKVLDWDNAVGYAVEQLPHLLYAPTDDFSLLCALPIAQNFKRRNKRSSGLEDMFVQAEYAFFTEKSKEAKRTQQATILASLSAPTGSPNKRPPTGYGAPTVFLGGTYNYTHVNWYAFISDGILLTSPHNHVKPANVVFYQGGLGRHLLTLNNDWYFAWIAEVDGYYAGRNRVNGFEDPGSGRNIGYFTNSVYVSSHSLGLLLKFGMGFPMYQQQPIKERYVLGGHIAIGF